MYCYGTEAKGKESPPISFKIVSAFEAAYGLRKVLSRHQRLKGHPKLAHKKRKIRADSNSVLGERYACSCNRELLMAEGVWDFYEQNCVWKNDFTSVR